MLLTLVMVVSLIPTTVWADDPGAVTAKVNFTAQAGNAFLIPPQFNVEVRSDLAESYGYTDSVPQAENVSALDVLVKVHEVMFADDFTVSDKDTFLEVTESQFGAFVATIFSVETSANGFILNGAYPNDGTESAFGGYNGTTVATQKVVTGDTVDFFIYQDTSYYLDMLSWFCDAEGTFIPSLSAAAGTSLSLMVKGYSYMGCYLFKDAAEMHGHTLPSAIADAQLAWVDVEKGTMTDIEDTTTDASGLVAVTAPSASGTYYLTAYTDTTDEYSTPVVMALLPVTVTGGSTPVQQDTLTSLAFYKSTSTTAVPYPMTPDFAADTKEYTLSVPDQDGDSLYVAATPNDSEKTVTAEWRNLPKEEKRTATVSATSRTTLVNCIKKGTTVNTVTLTIGDSEDAYTVNVMRTPTLQSLAIDGVRFNEQFAYGTNHYTAATSAETVTLTAKGYSDDYKITFNGSENNEIHLDPGENTVAVKVTNADGTLVNTYTVIINRKSTVKVTFIVNPTDAAVLVRDHFDAAVAPDADGSYSLLSGETYSYAATCFGYVSDHKEFTPTADQNIQVTLTAAPASSLTDVGAAWKNFRNSDVNMAITSARTPKAPETTALKWAKQLGSGWSAAPSVQIIVDNSLIVMSGTSLYKLNLSNRSIEQATMVNSPSFGYTPPTYAEGMIFCPLGNGTVQAFNAKTLESLWVYQDPGKGQALSPITYSDGYIYTGFWNNETKSDSYVCLSVTDEDPNETTETKYATWTKSVPGGFYWAGSVVVDDVLVVGTDDGANWNISGTSHLYALDKATGKELSKLPLPNMSDQRSSIAYSGGRVYFTTKGGYLCSAAVSSDGTLSDLKSANMGAQSTSTPIVYQGKVYVCAGSGVVDETIGKGAGHFIVADAATLKTISAVAMKGYPQCSPLLSTAYEDEGYLYFYCTYNKTPGGISLIKVKSADQSAELVELYDAAGYEQYCITSIICGTDGTLYYKNDSGNVFAVGVSTDAQKAQQVQDQIAAIGTVTLDSENAIKAARAAYDALTDAQKELVNNLSVLTDAEKKLAQLKKEKADQDAADAVVAKIQAVETAVASGDKAAIRQAIRAARTAYNSLTSAQKKLVTNYSVLTEAEKAYPVTSNTTKPGSTGGSSKPADSTVKSSDTGDSSRMMLWMGGVLLSAAALTVLTRKRKRS